MSVLLDSAIIDFGHSEENLDTFILWIDWLMCIDECI